MENNKSDDFLMPLSKDIEIFSLLSKELNRQENHLELIASENYVSMAVMQAQGSILTNKYAEGYPGKRYYAGCEFIDQIENIAIERAKKLFNVNFANVQPHSGSQANQAVFQALLEPGDTILGMDLNAGGHLTHGSYVNMSGKLYNSVSYGVTENGFLDYNNILEIAQKHKPKLIIAGSSTYSRFIDWEKFAEIAKEVGACLLADIAHYSGLIVADLYPSPVGYADVITTTTHKTLRGPRGGLILTNNEQLAKQINAEVFPGIQGGPLEHVIAAKAVCFQEAMTEEFKNYIQHTLNNAKAMANRFKEYDYKVISGGTDSHMFLLDLSSIEMKGFFAEKILEQAGIIVNKNTIPHDVESPNITSGIRIGTAALTTRGLNARDFKDIVDIIDGILTKKLRIEEALIKVNDITIRYPLYK